MYIIQLSTLYRIVPVNMLFQSSPISLGVYFHNRHYVTQGFDLSILPVGLTSIKFNYIYPNLRLFLFLVL